MSIIPNRLDQFPRTSKLPTQSAKFWVKDKDRYLRQLLISDIENHTQRHLIVYHAQLNESITHYDSDDLSEILDGIAAKDVDLMIQTPGGSVDACEKFITVLRSRLNSYRVIVPSMAKSCGTVIAMSSTEIVLGVNSELGPIDPQMGGIPCEIIARDPEAPFRMRELASLGMQRMSAMARKYLANGMLKGKSEDDIKSVVEQLASTNSYNSHGAVIDFQEARALGLNVKWLEPDDELWRMVWLLYSMYEYDSRRSNLGKIVEGSKNSIAKAITPVSA